MKYTAFSIDDVQNPLRCTQFKGWVKNELCFTGDLVQCVGKYGDTVEYSFLCLTEDFDEVVKAGWVDNQESVLQFSENNNQAAQLYYLDGGRTEVVGHLQHVDKATALANKDGWSYRPDLNQYWIIKVDHDQKRREAAHAAWLLAIRTGDKHVQTLLGQAFGFGQPAPRKNVIVPTDDTGTCFTIRNIRDH